MSTPNVRPIDGSFGRTAPPGPGEPPPHAPQTPPEDEKPPESSVAMEEQPSPTAGKKFPCEKCGGAMAFVPGASQLSCQYCGHSQPVPQSENEVRELCYKTYFAKGRVVDEVLEGAERETRCPGCGAQVILAAHVAADFCPFCASQLTNQIKAADPIMRPGGVVPFVIAKAKADELFHSWVKSRWFAPSALKEIDRLHRIHGVYLPYWTYDSMTYSFFAGQRGTYYYVTVGTGKNRTRQRRIRWTPVSGRVDHFFDDVLVCASNSVPPKLVNKMKAWNTKKVEPYDKSYIAGYRMERYQMSCEHGFDNARKAMDTHIESLVKARIGGDTQRISSIRTQYDGVTFKLILMPIWTASYKYNGKPYQVLINGQSGEISGERPYSWIKIMFAALAALVVVSVLVVLLGG